MPRPTVVIFDVNETLSDLEPLRGRFEQSGAPGQLLDTWFASTLRDGFALAAAGAYADFRTVALGVLRDQLTRVETLKVDPDEAALQIVDGLDELNVHPDVPDGVRRLATAGVRMATLSVGAPETALKLLQRAGVADLVEPLLSVAEVRRWKPAPEPYLYAARECGALPEQCVLVAVHPWDIDGAKRAGLRNGWINRRNLRYPSFFTSPDAAGDTLTMLADVLLESHSPKPATA